MRTRSLLVFLAVMALTAVSSAALVPAGAATAVPGPFLSDVLASSDAQFAGSTNVVAGNEQIVGIAGGASTRGYWEAAIDGGVFAFGDAHFYGSMGGTHLNQPVVGIAATPSGKGYWLVANDGGVFTFGDAHFYGSMGGTHLNQPVVGIAPTPTGKGYWLAASDGGIFTFGDARFSGSLGGKPYSQPIVGIAAPAKGPGYLLAAADGSVFPFGGEKAHVGPSRIAAAIVGIAARPTNDGYWLVDSNGRVFPHGHAMGMGGAVHAYNTKPIVGIAATRNGLGYWIVGRGTAPLYFLRGESLGVGTRDVHVGPGVSAATSVMRDLAAGPNAAERAAGLTSAIPAGTVVHRVTVSVYGTATVDVSPQFASGGGSLSVQERVAQVVFTLTALPFVKSVAFAIDGQHVTTIGGEGLIVDPPLTRAGLEPFQPQVMVVTPGPGDLVSSPLVITGRINAFEGTGTFELRASDGRLLAQGIGMGEMGNWLPFSTALAFEPGGASTGTLIARPSSGLEGTPPADAVIPVRFRP